MDPDPQIKSEVTTIKTESLPRPFWQGVLDDVHVNASGLFMFICLGLAVFWENQRNNLHELAALGGTYLFASAKNKDTK